MHGWYKYMDCHGFLLAYMKMCHISCTCMSMPFRSGPWLLPSTSIVSVGELNQMPLCNR